MALAFLSSAIAVDNKLEVGSKAPKIETIKGLTVVNDADTLDKTTVISFWSAKKPATRIKNKELSDKFAGNPDTDFISISIDSDADLAMEVMKMDEVKTLNFLSASQVPERVLKDYDAEKNPRAFVISPEGKISEIL